MWEESARSAFADLLPYAHPFPQPDPERWHALLADPAVAMLLVEQDRELLAFTGCGSSRDDDAGPSVAEIRSFFVASSHWRRGVGRTLIGAAIDELRRRGYLEVTLWSFAGNERANAFYESLGFARDGAERSEATWAYLPEVRYRRSL